MQKTLLSLLAAAFLSAGCSTLSQDEAFRSMERMTAERGAGELKWLKTSRESDEVQTTVKGLLASPFNEENAVRIALINNRTLQQAYARIGIAQSDLVQAGLMSNPLLGYSLGHGGGASRSTITLELAFLDLLWIPLRKELGGLALEEAKLSVGDEVLQTVRDAKKRYIDTRIAAERVRLNGEILKSYETSLQLAIRQHTAGNLTKRDYLKIEDDYYHARLESIRLNREYAAAREALNAEMGVYGDQTRYSLSGEALELPNQPLENGMLERLAMENRLDIAAAKKAVDYAAAEAGYTKNSRLLQEVTLEAQREIGSAGEQFTTYGFKIPIPIFDVGQGRVSKAQARYNQSVHHLNELAVTIRSQTREGYAKLRYDYDIAHEYQAIAKTNHAILEQTQLYYNGMLDGIYELLADQRRYSDAKIQSLVAIGEYRKSYADLTYTVGGKGIAPKDAQ